MKHLLLPLLLFLCLPSCHHNRVSVKVKNASDYDFKRITVRFGDTLHMFHDLAKGDVTPHFWANKNYGRGFTKVVLSSLDTITYAPQDLSLGHKKIYYRGKILVKVNIGKTGDKRDTILIKTRRRFLF